jgi:hypothetical protein
MVAVPAPAGEIIRQASNRQTGSLLPTAGIAGLLYKHQVHHPWLVKATEFCWRKIEALEQTNAYEVRFVLPFLEHAPDRVRAERAFARIGPQIFAQHWVTLAPDAPGEVHTPLNFAPRPDCWARELFSDEVLDAHLDALVARQQADGCSTGRIGIPPRHLSGEAG